MSGPTAAGEPRITVISDGAEHGLDEVVDIGAELAERLGVPVGDLVVDSARPSMGGAWVAVRIFAPITNRLPAPAPEGRCRACGRPFSPTHDINAPGPTSRHDFQLPVTRAGGEIRGGPGVRGGPAEAGT